MKSLWDDKVAASFNGDLLQLRTYTSNLIGQSENLVLHGGGNTSVKIAEKNFFGEDENYLYVKGSGWDLATIKPEGFSPVKMDTLMKLAALESLSDSDMVREQKAAMKNPSAPAPSVEAILHATIPFKFVDHTHADAVVTLTNVHGDIDKMKKIFGENVLFVPYIMPGFVLARKVYEMTRDADWSKLDGIILMNHGVFTFSDDPKQAYEKMIEIVSTAEKELENNGIQVREVGTAEYRHSDLTEVELLQMAELRQEVSKVRGQAMVARLSAGEKILEFAKNEKSREVCQRGPITPDHTIHTKSWPMVFTGDVKKDIESFVQDYKAYFESNKTEGVTILDQAPRWGLWPNKGVLSFADNAKRLDVIADINAHTVEAMSHGEKLSGWKGLPREELFDVEYWELEQAKLKKAGSPPPMQGKIAMVTGAASGIGKAIAEELISQGVCVCAIDINPEVEEMFTGPSSFGISTDVTDISAMKKALSETVQRFGGVDIIVSNAGIFPPGKSIEELPDEQWDKSLEINLTSAQRFLKMCTPFLKKGIEPAVVIVASKNVPAPGPGASAYSVAKAGLTQLSRVAALELGPHGIPVNILHPNAVFDTGIWTQDVLENRAKHYGLTVEEYKKNNVLKKEVTSKDVAQLACALAGPLFAKTTGAQIPIDGGNERVI